MFSGIIEGIAVVKSVRHDKDNVDITLTCPFAGELAVSQSLAHNGVCLTVTSVSGSEYTTTAMRETLERSNIGLLEPGSEVNVERPVPVNGRLDGHIVQGHVDTTAECVGIEDARGSYVFTFRYAFDRELAGRGYFCVDKGSVTVNGVSLTVCNPTDDTFQVNIIPFTFEHTNFHTFRIGSVVNIEFDVLGKMVSRLVQLGK